MKIVLAMTRILICVFVFLLCLPDLVCLGQSWSTLPVDLVVNMNTSSPGTALTTNILNTGTVSNTCTVGSSCNWSSVNSGFTVGANQAQCSNLGGVSLNNGGATYAAQSLNFNSIAHNDAFNNTNVTLDFNSSQPSNISALMCVTLGPPAQNNGTDWDIFGFWGSPNGAYVVIQLNPSCPSFGQYGVRLESDWNGSGSATTHSPICIPLVPQKTYLFSVNYNMVSPGLGTLYVYTPQGTLIGNTTVTARPQSYLNFVTVGNNEAGNNSGTTTYFQNILMDWTNHANPLIWTNGSATVKPPTNLTAIVQ